MTEYFGCDGLREWIVAQGWTIATDTLARGRECNWYAYRRTALEAIECETNDGRPLQIVVWPARLRANDGTWWESASVEVTGEAGGMWYTIKAYSLQHDVLKARLPQIEASLVAAWNALGREKP